MPGARQDLAGRLRSLQRPLRQRLASADVLVDMARAVHASLVPERVAESLLARAEEWIPAPAWLVAGRDDAGMFRVLAARALEGDLEQAARQIGGWVLRTGRLFAAANVAGDARVAGGEAVAAAALGFPLESRGRVVGAMVAVDPAPASREPAFAPETLAVLRAALEAGGIALDNALRIERAESLSVTDDLTQLYNSRYLSQVLRRETKRASRSGRPLSLLFVDLDGFKAVNDMHGHLVGSSALVEAAAVIRSSARETDVVARFGGDEFALILPDTGSEGAVAVGGRVRDKIAAHRFLTADGLDIALTVSVGVATLPDVAASADQLLRAADQAMYQVKDLGKNGIRVASG